MKFYSLIESFPDFLSPNHLTSLGLYTSPGAILAKIRRGCFDLPYLRIGKKIRFLKADVLDSLEASYKTNSIYKSPIQK